MRKIFLVILLFSLFLIVLPADAMTQAEIQSLIVQVERQIAELQGQLQTLLAQQGASAPTTSAPEWCHTFNINLGFANSGSDEVVALHMALQKQGISYGTDSLNEYREGTATAIAFFQERYASDILSPYGLTRGTGYVGRNTRAKLNALYGCVQVPVACIPNWRCDSWSVCSDNAQTRACFDLNNCGVATTKPSVMQGCTSSCTPDWQCGSWSACANSQETRTCADANSCGITFDKPNIVQRCVPNPSETCSDSDGGNDIYTKGTTCVGDYCETDYCKYDNTVTEFYCSVKNGVDMVSWEYMPCAGGVCSGGICIPGGSNCKNDCILGSTYCTSELYSSTGKIYLKQCGNYDSDPCVEWGSPVICFGDTSCGYGKCPNNMKPNWYCNSAIGQGACDYSCVESSSCCVAKTCSQLICGVHDNGCGGTIDCGSCSSVCSSINKSCGKWNYSGTQVSCGQCPLGQYCNNGQCLASTVSCVDSDEVFKRSLRESIKGGVISSLGFDNDSCSDPASSAIDYYCENGTVQSREDYCGAVCDYGRCAYNCKEGFCLPYDYATANVFCSDRNNAVSFIYHDDVYNLTDYCVEDKLIDYSCNNFYHNNIYFKWIKAEVKKCDNGCSNAKCINSNL